MTKEERKEYNRKYHKEWYQKNKERIREKKRLTMQSLRQRYPERYAKHYRKSKAKLKETLFEMYGHECATCGFSDKRALTLDHKLNNGNEERKELGERGVYRRARDNYLPSEYQILCMNCQFIKRTEDNRVNQYGCG